MTFGPNFLVYSAGGGERDEVRTRAMAKVLGLSAYDARMLIAAPGPRRVAAFVKQEEAEAKALELRQAGVTGFVVDKARFSRLPVILRALSCTENEEGCVFRINRGGEEMEYPQPKGIVRAVVLGSYSQTTIRQEIRGRFAGQSTQKTVRREPFVHVYADDPHTVLEITGTGFTSAWVRDLGPATGDLYWQQLATKFAVIYGAAISTLLFRTPEEQDMITAPLNVTAVGGGIGPRGKTGAVEDSPIAMAASRIVAYSIAFGL